MRQEMTDVTTIASVVIIVSFTGSIVLMYSLITRREARRHRGCDSCLIEMKKLSWRLWRHGDGSMRSKCNMQRRRRHPESDGWDQDNVVTTSITVWKCNAIYTLLDNGLICMFDGGQTWSVANRARRTAQWATLLHGAGTAWRSALIN